MRSVEERVISVRKRELGKNLKTRSLAIAGVCSLVCLVPILVVVGSDATTTPSAGEGLYGASVFGEAVGGYVLVALVSFVAAVTLTITCLRRRAYRDKATLFADQGDRSQDHNDSRSVTAPTTKER